jgi:uncharacterized membrane protein
MALLLAFVGLIGVNYAYLHDVIWQTQDGFIVMGLKGYLIALAGTLAVLSGIFLRFGGR